MTNKELNKELYVALTFAAVIIITVSILAINSEATRPQRLPHGITIVEVKGHEYLKLATGTGSSLTHSASCPNHIGGN